MSVIDSESDVEEVVEDDALDRAPVPALSKGGIDEVLASCFLTLAGKDASLLRYGLSQGVVAVVVEQAGVPVSSWAVTLPRCAVMAAEACRRHGLGPRNLPALDAAWSALNAAKGVVVQLASAAPAARAGLCASLIAALGGPVGPEAALLSPAHLFEQASPDGAAGGPQPALFAWLRGMIRAGKAEVVSLLLRALCEPVVLGDTSAWNAVYKRQSLAAAAVAHNLPSERDPVLWSNALRGLFAALGTPNSTHYHGSPEVWDDVGLVECVCVAVEEEVTSAHCRLVGPGEEGPGMPLPEAIRGLFALMSKACDLECRREPQWAKAHVSLLAHTLTALKGPGGVYPGAVELAPEEKLVWVTKCRLHLPSFSFLVDKL